MTEKGSRHRPWFPFYGADFAGTVRTWSSEEIGCYVLLLIEQWVNGSIPTDVSELARIHPDIVTHWQAKLRDKFPQGRNERLEEIRQETIAKRDARSEAGRTAAHARWGTTEESDADAMPSHMQSQSERITNDDAIAMLPTPIPIPIDKPTSKTKNKRTVVTNAMWKAFCDLYPKRDGADPIKPARGRAERALKNGAAWSDIMAGLRRYREHCDTSKIERQFIKRKENFLNPQNEFWNAEYADAEQEQGEGVGTTDDLLSMADILNVMRLPGETDDDYRHRLKSANDQRIAKLGS